MLQVAAVIHVLLSLALVTLVLMHSGRDTGLGGMGFTPASQGGTHIVERNLTRLTVFAKKSAPTITVSRVRFRSTMCVPPCEAGVKPIPPRPVSRPECISTSATRARESRTWMTAATWSTAAV